MPKCNLSETFLVVRESYGLLHRIASFDLLLICQTCVSPLRAFGRDRTGATKMPQPATPRAMRLPLAAIGMVAGYAAARFQQLSPNGGITYNSQLVRLDWVLSR